MESLLKSLGENLYYAEAEVKFYGINIQTRMTVAKLPDGGLWVCSPLILTHELERELNALGPVRHVLSPNKIHSQGISSFAERYLEARLWASPGLAERRRDLRFYGTLGDKPEPEWASDFEQLTTDGNSFFSEVVFFHKKTKTLIVADLVENITAETVPSHIGQAAAKAVHIFGKVLSSPEFRMYTVNPNSARAKMNQIAEWPFERIIVAHGDFITEDAHEVFRSVSDHLFEEVSARSSYRRALYRFLAQWQ